MRTVKIYTVIFTEHRAQAGTDGTDDHIFRTRIRAEAEDFAKGRRHYAEPATVEVDDISARIVARWGL